jgi:hypothetical protein
MELRADRVRVGHSIGGARVIWARPLPDGRSLVIALQASRGNAAVASPARIRVYRVDDLVEVDDQPGRRA